MIETNLLNKGDTIVVKTALNVTMFLITRVTKTLAKSKRKDGFEHTFKREILLNIA